MENQFWEILKEELGKQKLTHKDLSDKLEMPKATLETKFIRKNPPDIDFVYKVSKVLNVSMEYLVSGENPPYKKRFNINSRHTAKDSQ